MGILGLGRGLEDFEGWESGSRRGWVLMGRWEVGMGVHSEVGVFFSSLIILGLAGGVDIHTETWIQQRLSSLPLVRPNHR